MAYSIIQIDDIHTLDLPILYYKDEEQAEIIDFCSDQNNNQNEDKQKDNLNETTSASNWLRINEFTNEAIEKYDMLSKRTPFTFEMYKTKTLKSNDSVCKLPLMFFWLRKPVNSNRHKNTGTQSIKDIVLDLTGLDISKQTRQQIEKLIEKKTHLTWPLLPLAF